MKKYNRFLLVALLFHLFIVSGESQITKSKYELVFDEVNCEYLVYLHVIEGNAITIPQRVPFHFGISLILPVESSASLTESIVPHANAWTVSNYSAIPPDGDLNKTFVEFKHGVGTYNLYPEMHEGDVILLLKFSVDYDVQGVKGIRHYISGVDYPGGGGAYGSGFVLGSAFDSHLGFLPTQFASEYAEAIGPSFIYVDKKTTLSPTSGGTWTQTNPSVTSFDPTTNEVTGLSIGRNIFTYNGSGCSTSVVIEVVPDAPFEEPVGIGEGVGDPTVKFGIYGTDAGILIPRMSENQRLCISYPDAGLLVYQTDNEDGFYYFSGQSWKRLSNSVSEGTSSLTNEPMSNLTINESELIQDLLNKQEELLLQYEQQAVELNVLLKESSNQ